MCSHTDIHVRAHVHYCKFPSYAKFFVMNNWVSSPPCWTVVCLAELSRQKKEHSGRKVLNCWCFLHRLYLERPPRYKNDCPGSKVCVWETMIRLQQFAEVNKMYHRTAQLRDLFVYLIRPGKLCVLPDESFYHRGFRLKIINTFYFTIKPEQAVVSCCVESTPQLNCLLFN